MNDKDYQEQRREDFKCNMLFWSVCACVAALVYMLLKMVFG